MRMVLYGILVVAMIAGGVAFAQYRSDLRAAHARIQGASSVVPSPYGELEYARGGSGPDVLVVHGAGGGFDQGSLLAQIVLGDEAHWIAPSRFGYLGSTVGAGATVEDQAHAYAFLLDHLGIETVAVIAVSAGGTSALLFALLHPERVTSLTLLSAGVAPLASDEQAGAHRRGTMLARIFQNDFLYWAANRLFARQTMLLMGVDDDAIARLSAEQRDFADRFIASMLPVSLRSAGATFDNAGGAPGDRIVGITAPTLIVHAQDDTLQLYDHATFAATHIPGSTLLSFERGGHFVLITEQEEVSRAVLTHVRDQAR